MVHKHKIEILEWKPLYGEILDLEEKGLVTRTFRRLDPPRQQAVLEAILAEAVERGPEQVNIKHIAERAGVSVGSLYQYFENREKLLEFTIELVGRYMCETIGKNRDKILQLSFREGLAAYVSAILTWGESRITLIRFLNRSENQDRGKYFKEIKLSIDLQLKEVLRDLLKKAQEEGTIRKDINLETLVDLMFILNMVHLETSLFPEQDEYCLLVNRKKPHMEEIFNDLMEMLMKGIAPIQARKK